MIEKIKNKLTIKHIFYIAIICLSVGIFLSMFGSNAKVYYSDTSYYLNNIILGSDYAEVTINNATHVVSGHLVTGTFTTTLSNIRTNTLILQIIAYSLVLVIGIGFPFLPKIIKDESKRKLATIILVIALAVCALLVCLTDICAKSTVLSALNLKSGKVYVNNVLANSFLIIIQALLVFLTTILPDCLVKDIRKKKNKIIDIEVENLEENQNIF